MTKYLTTIAITAGLMGFAAISQVRAADSTDSTAADTTPADSEFSSYFGSRSPIPAQPVQPAPVTTAAAAQAQPAANASAPATSTATTHPVAAAHAAQPARWPQTVRIKQAIPFPAVFNGRVVGSMLVPAGTVVQLSDVQGTDLVLTFQGATQRVSWQYTTIEEQMDGAFPPATQAAGSAQAVAARGTVR